MPTVKEIEQLVVDNGCPENLIVPDADFSAIYEIHRVINRDDSGAFILVLNTKVRPKTVGPETVDLGETDGSVFPVKKEEAI